MKLDLQEDEFVNDLGKELATPGVRPVEAIERLLSQHLTASLKSYLVDRLVKPPTALIYPGYNKNTCPTLLDLAREGYQTWYSEIRFATPPSEALDEITLEPVGITLGEIDYGQGVKRAYQLKTKKLKKQTNHTLRLNILRIEGRVFERTRLALLEKTLEQPYIANPRPGPRSAGFEHGIKGFEFVSFDHLLNCERLFCSCAKPAHQMMLATAKAEA